ncbi:MAG: ABC transporter ATP-binding protein [Rhodospirillaceae bacterium]
MIRLTDVKFRWQANARPVLDIRSFSVARGERVFLKGPSGSGKTTLLNLLGGVAVPEAGQVSVMDTNLAAMRGARRDAFRADHIGFIFQMFNLVPYLSLIDNVALPCRFSAARRRKAESSGMAVAAEARRLLARMGLDAESVGDRPVTELSVGQQQRVAAARSLIGAPELLIADEPTSALDAETRMAFLDLLFSETAAAGSTLLFVSHDSALEVRFDRVVALRDVNRAAEDAAAPA